MEQGELVGDVFRQQIATGGEHLAEFNEDGAEALERLPNTLTTRRVKAPAQTQEKESAGQHSRVQTSPGPIHCELVKPVLPDNPENREQSKKCVHSQDPGGSNAVSPSAFGEPSAMSERNANAFWSSRWDGLRLLSA